MDDFEVDDVVQQALDRLTLLAEAATALSSTLDPQRALERVCHVMVARLADWCAVDVVEEGGGGRRRACVVQRGPATAAVHPPAPAGGAAALDRVLAGAGPLLLLGEQTAPAGPRPPADTAGTLQPEPAAGPDAHSAIIAPLRSRRQVFGALTLARTGGRPPLTADDLPLAEDLAHRIALSLDNARLHRQTQHIAERLQRSLLPDLPTTGPLHIAGRYVPAATTAEVGGDWYDSFTLPSGATALIIGDVTGHDLRAAIGMSQLRNMLRGIGCDRQEPPHRILQRLDLAHHTLNPDATATCIYGILEQDTLGSWTLDHSSAGHPPPLLITREGDTRYLDGGRGLLLGVEPAWPRTDASARLPAHATVLLYTDGLIERRREPLDTGLTRLRQHAAALSREPLEAFCDAIIAGLSSDHADDVAILAVRVPVPAHSAPTASRRRLCAPADGERRPPA
ncbi:PP2C family protein-serine/threonine phosphatase [Streptomyces sp. NPDC058655]|uniref:PP2C family protein-serine/threonine phosphatase n=1 Tax=unclassified Streptomyces TaxID=2593676 RepID=UPI0036687744